MSGDLPRDEAVMQAAVDHLRDATTNRNTILDSLAEDARKGSTYGQQRELFGRAARERQELRVSVEDAALKTIGSVYESRFDYDDVVEVIERSESGSWVNPMILARALYGYADKGGDE